MISLFVLLLVMIYVPRVERDSADVGLTWCAIIEVIGELIVLGQWVSKCAH